MEAFAQQEVLEIKETLGGLIASEDGIFNVHKFFDVPFVNIIWGLVTGFRFSHDDPQVKELVNGITDINRTLKFSGGGLLASFPILVDILPERLTGVGKCRRAMENFRYHMEVSTAVGAIAYCAGIMKQSGMILQRTIVVDSIRI